MNYLAEDDRDGSVSHIQRALNKAREAQSGFSIGFDPPHVAAPRSAPAPATQPSRVTSMTGSTWSTLRQGVVDPDEASRNRLVSLNQSDASHTAFDILRTRVRQLMRQNGWRSLAITSPRPGCGKTLVGLNLAFSMANQKDSRIALVDLDLRRPQVASMLNMASPPRMEELFSGQKSVADVFVRYSENLAVAANSQPVSFSAELLQSASTRTLINDIKAKLAPDVMIFDLPPMLASDDVAAFLPNVDCAILIAAAEQSTKSEIELCERQLSESTNLLGVVLNKCRFTPEKYGY